MPVPVEPTLAPLGECGAKRRLAGHLMAVLVRACENIEIGLHCGRRHAQNGCRQRNKSLARWNMC